MKFLYDISYDLCLNLLAVGSGYSGWHNSDIRKDCAKMMRLQDLLAANTAAFSADDSLVLGKQVTTCLLFCVCVCVFLCVKIPCHTKGQVSHAVSFVVRRW